MRWKVSISVRNWVVVAPDTAGQAGLLLTAIRRWPSRQKRSLTVKFTGGGSPSTGCPAVM